MDGSLNSSSNSLMVGSDSELINRQSVNKSINELIDGSITIPHIVIKLSLYGWTVFSFSTVLLSMIVFVWMISSKQEPVRSRTGSVIVCSLAIAAIYGAVIHAVMACSFLWQLQDLGEVAVLTKKSDCFWSAVVFPPVAARFFESPMILVESIDVCLACVLPQVYKSFGKLYLMLMLLIPVLCSSIGSISAARLSSTLPSAVDPQTQCLSTNVLPLSFLHGLNLMELAIEVMSLGLLALSYRKQANLEKLQKPVAVVNEKVVNNGESKTYFAVKALCMLTTLVLPQLVIVSLIYRYEQSIFYFDGFAFQGFVTFRTFIASFGTWHMLIHLVSLKFSSSGSQIDPKKRPSPRGHRANNGNVPLKGVDSTVMTPVISTLRIL